MKRLFAGVGVAGVLALGLFAGHSVASPQKVGACGWYLYEPGHYVTVPTNVQFGLLVFSDGCGDFYYTETIHNYAAGAYADFSIRVWVCGRYIGDWQYTNYISQNSGLSHSSPAYAYAGCGPQTDNYVSVTYTTPSYGYPTTYLHF